MSLDGDTQFIFLSNKLCVIRATRWLGGKCRRCRFLGVIYNASEFN